MAYTSKRITIGSAILLVVVVVLYAQMYLLEPESEDTLLTWRDMQIQIATSRDIYTLGEGFTATVYLVNNRSEEVQMKPITSCTIEGGRDVGYSGLASSIDWTIAAGTVTTLPANSKKKLIDQYFTPEQTGEFIITSLGVNKPVLIYDPPSEGETVNAMMNKHSFKNTDDATLYITNVGLNRITFGDEYEIQKKDGDSWAEVSLSLYRSIWLDYRAFLDPEGVSRQTIKIENLEPGRYRISKTVEDSISQESYTLIVEFEMRAPAIPSGVNASHPKITVNGTISFEEFPIPPPVGEDGDPSMHNVFVVDTNTTDYHDGIYYLQRDWQDDQPLGRIPPFYSNMFFVESQGNDTVGGLPVNEWVEAMMQGYLVEIRGYDMTTSIGPKRYCIICVTEAEIIPYLKDSP